MSRKAHGQIRRSQVITTWGPGALLDLPRYAVIVGGLDTWPKASDLEEISESRLAHKLQIMTGVAAPRLYAPPADSNDPRESKKGIGLWRFPEWFVVQEEGGSEERERSRRLVHRKALDERGTSGDLADLVVRCECKKSRNLYEATELEMNPLGTCRGARPWLGRHAHEECKGRAPARLR